MKEEKQKVETAYHKQLLIDQHKLTIRTNDLAVFDFIMNVTNCDGPSSILAETLYSCNMAGQRRAFANQRVD